MPYIVHNLTKKTVILSDIRAEIKPCMTLDLERYAHREDIERSFDLIQAIKGGKLRLVSHGINRTFAQPAPQSHPQVMQVTERIIEKQQTLTKEQLEEIIRKVISENKGVAVTNDLQKIINDAIGTGLANITEVLKQGGQGGSVETQIDPEKLAQIQQQSINKVFEDLQTGKGKEKKVVQSKNVDDLAKELLD